jgi:predicted GNAT family N-acyltransferase
MSLAVKRSESHEEAEAVRILRTRVFVEEQGVAPELEIDGLDDTAVHAVAYQDGAVIGTGRLILDTSTDARIGRMAVEASLRRSGVGSAVLAFLESEARSQGIIRVTLHAQYYVKEFYAKRGYHERGDTFMEAGILHVEMTKDIA